MRNKVSEKAPLVKVAVSLMAGTVLVRYLVIPFALYPLLVVVVLLAFCLWRYEYLQSADSKNHRNPLVWTVQRSTS